mgnify:CR=1 FL=1
MRFTLMTGLGGIEDYRELARAAEQTGWTSLAIPDSLFYPEVTESDYPYMDTDAVRQVGLFGVFNVVGTDCAEETG